RVGARRDHLERGCARDGRYPDGPQRRRRPPRPDHQLDPARAAGSAGGGRKPRVLPRVRRGGLHHRRQRRHPWRRTDHGVGARADSMCAMPTDLDDATAVADALWATLEEFASLPGGHVVDAGDATLVVSERPYANFNNVMATFIDEAAADRRIAAILGAFPESSVPLTWWAGPTTRPA